MGCNTDASPNLHGAIFHSSAPCPILPYMERKRRNYIREWRKKRGLTQNELLARIVELAGDKAPDDPDLRVPMTGASLSRIENGIQNFTMATLVVLADALDVDEPGWLLDRNPLKEGVVISIVERLNAEQAAKAAEMLELMFGATGTSDN